MNDDVQSNDHASVLIVIASAQRRGAEIDGLRLAESLRDLGHASAVAALTAGHGGTLPVQLLGRKALSLPTLWRLRRVASNFDVVVAYGSTTLPACAIALVGSRTKWVYRSIGDPRAWASGRLRQLRTGLLMRRSTHVVALYPAASDAIGAMYSVATPRRSTIPNDRPSERFRPPTAQERSDARSALGLDDGATVVGFVGALSPEKRVDLAIETVGALPTATLVVAGDGPMREPAERLAAQTLEGRVRWLGSVDDVVPVLHAADAVLLTSRTEGMPGALVEAAMCGVPAVATDVGAVREVVVDGRTGRVVDSAAPAALADALRQVLQTGPQMGGAAATFARDHFDTGVVVPQWSRLLDSLRQRR